jgi:hypothetical protein
LTLRDGIALAKLYGVTLNELDPTSEPNATGPDAR